MWKATIDVGGANLPIKMYSAAAGDRGVSFRLLSEKDQEPVRQRMVDPSTDEEVPPEKVRRGFEIEPGVFVLFEPEELAELEPEPSRSIAVTRFVPKDYFGPEWFDRPYWLAPDGREKEYFAFAKALAESGREGIAHWVMRKHRYVGALRSTGEHLALVTLRFADEVVPASAIETPRRAIDPRERKLAEDLVKALQGELDLAQFKDEYAERVREIAEQKAQGKRIRAPRAKKKEAGKSLAETLKRSLASTRPPGEGAQTCLSVASER
jgi:DNA end-binding protein Ku